MPLITIDINLLPQEFRPRPEIRTIPILIGLVVLILAFYFGMTIFTTASALKQVRTEKARVEKSIKDIEDEVKEYDDLVAYKKKVEQMIETFNYIGDGAIRWSTVVESVADNLPPNLWISNASTDTEKKAGEVGKTILSISGYVKEPKILNEADLVAALKDLYIYRDIHFKETKAELYEEKKVQRFTIELTLEPAATFVNYSPDLPPTKRLALTGFDIINEILARAKGNRVEDLPLGPRDDEGLTNDEDKLMLVQRVETNTEGEISKDKSSTNPNLNRVGPR